MIAFHCYVDLHIVELCFVATLPGNDFVVVSSAQLMLALSLVSNLQMIVRLSFHRNGGCCHIVEIKLQPNQ